MNASRSLLIRTLCWTEILYLYLIVGILRLVWIDRIEMMEMKLKISVGVKYRGNDVK